MSWCPIDSSYLLSCAKDNRTIGWDTLSGEIVCELPGGSNSNFDVHWYPKIPGVISASSFDGKIGLYNIGASSQYGENDFGAAPLRAPKWYKRPAGVSFGFGGKLLSFHSRSPATGSQGRVGVSEVYVHNLVIEDSLVTRATEFQAAMQNGERDALRTVCEKKEKESESEDDRETWGILKVMFEDNGTARTKLLTHLGFSLPGERKDNAKEDVVQQVNTLSMSEVVAQKEDYPRETAVFFSDNGGSTDPAVGDAVQRALVVGDYKGAVAQCITANRMADALVIAHIGSPSLWKSTRDQYLKKSNLPYLKVVSAMVDHNLTVLVNTRPLKSWKETLALLCTFSQRDEWTSLCNALASKLLAAGKILAATVCYISAGNIEETVEIWSWGLSGDSEGKSYANRLQDLMEKTLVFALATGQKHFGGSLFKVVEKYAEILASQGLLSTAMEFLKLLGEDLSPELLILRDRISLSTDSVEEGSVVYAAGDVANQPNYLLDENSQHYYQDMALPPLLQSQPVPPSSYSEKYQQYPRNYAASATYNPTPSQQHMFFPSQTPQLPQPNFVPPPVDAQPVVKQFMPAVPTVLKNADQFQQPLTMASQLYPGAGNATYLPSSSLASSSGPVAPLTVPVPGPKMPNDVAPFTSPAGRAFMPVNGPRVGAAPPGTSSTQPYGVAHYAPVQPAVAPEAPPSTVQTADTSRVPGEQKPIIVTLTRLSHDTMTQVGGAPARKKEMEDNSRRVDSLFEGLNKGHISKKVIQKLLQLCDYLDKGHYHSAMQCQVQLATSDWDECQYWLAALKRMIRMSHKA